MRGIICCIVSALVLAGSSTWLSAQPPSAQRIATDPDVQGAQRLFSAWLEGQMLERGLPGVAVGVVADQELVWAAGFGLADTASKITMTPQTKFRMASHSKLFTATAVMQLREQGKLRLDDPVSKYLPWFKLIPTESEDPPITIEELLTHSSGLPREAGAYWTTFDFPTTEQLRALMPARQAPFAPEVRWKYSNLAYSVAGMIVETVTGQKWADYVHREIFQPLGMTASSVDKNVSGLAVGYGRRMPDGARAINPSSTRAGWRPRRASRPRSRTWPDLHRRSSERARAAERRFSAPARCEMHRVRVLESNWTQGNAIGFAVRRAGDKVYVSHGGSYPGYQTNTMLWPDGKVGVIVLTNADDGNPAALATELMNTVGQAVAKVAARPPARFTWDPSWSRFAGLYRGRGGDSRVVELNKRLVVVSSTSTNLDNPVQLEPIGNGQFRYVASVGGGPVGEIVRFVEENGRVTRMITGDSYVERVQP